MTSEEFYELLNQIKKNKVRNTNSGIKKRR